jgi:molybdenum-dependent DNA-binding transcriptional regulator ModE
MMELATLDVWLRKLIDKHGSVRKAAEATGIDHAYFWRLLDGEKTNPSEETLEKLNLREAYVLYERRE